MKAKVWLLTLLVSPVLDIIWQETENGSGAFYVPLMVKLLLLGLVSLYERQVKKGNKLSNYLMILFIILSLSSSVQYLTKAVDVEPWLRFLPNDTSRELFFFQLVRLISVLILILILRAGFGFSRSYLFLQKGHPRALSRPLPQFGWKKTES